MMGLLQPYDVSGVQGHNFVKGGIVVGVVQRADLLQCL